MMRPWLAFLLKAAVSIALLAVLVQRVDGAALLARLRQADSLLLLAALLAYLPAILLQAWRLCGVARPLVRLRYGPALAITWIGHAFGQLLPSQIGGDPFRVWYLGKQDIRLRQGFLIVLADRVFGFIALFLLLAVGLPWLFGLSEDTLLRGFAIALVLAGLAAWLGAVWFDRLAMLLLPPAWQRRLPALLGEMAVFLRQATFRPGPALNGFGLSLLAYLAQTLMAWLLARGLGLDIGFLALLILMPLANIAAFLPVSIAGWGLREAVLVPALALLGLPGESALALSILIGLVQLAAALPGLAVWLALRR
ncbi:lysylphosphatidylglycerol synthase transmembrane domain-containing protein [Ferrovibrio sp.]|uniref:lysylphosphatidylglycerol synthase transmembrane domain-containing protein n=1 Tax=Ferrovibrio sp. TaxID=1917215 RepID=UPI0025C5A390|nr:lysylphosphatidylglycerol synthase transmembrane domain-containing protein [Ferrovibrio sp.]MBX3456069.1 flippase-like domain-containing protein [Ferrovibrio sp.]